MRRLVTWVACAAAAAAHGADSNKLRLEKALAHQAETSKALEVSTGAFYACMVSQAAVYNATANMTASELADVAHLQCQAQFSAAIRASDADTRALLERVAIETKSPGLTEEMTQLRESGLESFKRETRDKGRAHFLSKLAELRKP